MRILPLLLLRRLTLVRTMSLIHLDLGMIVLSLMMSRKMKYVFEDITKCQTAGTKYRGHRQALGETRPVNIPKNESVEAQIVADVLEDGFSLMQATRQVNHHLKETEQPLVSFVSFSSVWHLSKRLKPLYKRLPNGKLDPNGEYSEEDKVILNVKYDDETCVSLGYSANATEGRVVPLFDYSGKTLLTIKDYGNKKKLEIVRIKTLSEKSGWVKKGRVSGTPYKEDPLTAGKVANLGDGTIKKLKSVSPPINTFGKLAKLTKGRIKELVQQKVASKKNLEEWKKICQAADDAPPAKQDYHKESNPYEA
ncbi:unknown protein [Seminavis robusta]|uniref:Uncharacterized protein n=1 Tax=Seminavis robusta TaxID=568900 RepID=A0A9N8EP41_9STRA|nr:unknown protein [Seminavis robusta]|eukprot:Sro1354_g265410.1 n/a (308) ;mRNA; f:5190-6618